IYPLEPEGRRTELNRGELLADHLFASWSWPRSLLEKRTDGTALAHLLRQHRDGEVAAVNRTRYAQCRTFRHNYPCADAQFSKAGDPRYFWTEHIKSYGEDISLTWFDIGEPLLIHTQPNQVPDRRYGLCTVLIPA